VVGEGGCWRFPLCDLGFLWLAFFVLSTVAYFAILITGRYPRAIFEEVSRSLAGTTPRAGRKRVDHPSSFSYLPLTYRETNAYRIVVAEQPDGHWQIALLQNSVT
jgi:hypothetical protein